MEKTDVFDVIERMATLIRSEERKKCATLGLQLVHLQTLDYLSRCNRYSDTPAALTSFLGTTKGTISQTLKLLEKKGYIKKVADTKDRRKVHLHILTEGKTVLEKGSPSSLFNQATSILKENGTDIHNEVFIQVLVALQKANKSESFGLCKSCKYFTKTSTELICGLTKENLSEADSEKICREHSLF